MLYLIEPVDEYCIQSLPEFEGKKFQNVAKEGLKLDDSEKSKERLEALDKEYEPVVTWLKDEALKDQVCSYFHFSFKYCASWTISLHENRALYRIKVNQMYQY